MVNTSANMSMSISEMQIPIIPMITLLPLALTSLAIYAASSFTYSIALFFGKSTGNILARISGGLSLRARSKSSELP